MTARPLPLAFLALALLMFGASCATQPAKTTPEEIIGLEVEGPKTPATSQPQAQKTGTPPVMAGTPSTPPPLPARRIWTVAEVRAWYPGYLKNEPASSRGLMYQGSDPTLHYFVARVSTAKTWYLMAIAKSDLRMPEEKPTRIGANPPQGHGFVDPMNGFRALPRGTKP